MRACSIIRHCRLGILPLGAMVAACGILPEPPATEPPAQQPAAQIAAPLGTDEVLSRLGTLPAQQISNGECGLFLWAKREDRPLVFFQHSSGNALMRVDGSVLSLTRNRAEDQIALQFHRSQQFDVADLSVTVSITPEETQSLQQGLKLPTGSVLVETASGWSAALPVAGAIGCQ